MVVVDESERSRLLLAEARPRRRRRRRLADLVDVQFEISFVSGSESEGEKQTGSQEAASLFNKMADPVSTKVSGDVLLACGVTHPLFPTSNRMALPMLFRFCVLVRHVRSS